MSYQQFCYISEEYIGYGLKRDINFYKVQVPCKQCYVLVYNYIIIIDFGYQIESHVRNIRSQDTQNC